MYTYTPIHLYTYTPIHLYTYTPINLYTYTPIHLYTYTLCLFNTPSTPIQPLKSSNMAEVVQEWYSSFVVVEQEVLFELVCVLLLLYIQYIQHMQYILSYTLYTLYYHIHMYVHIYTYKHIHLYTYTPIHLYTYTPIQILAANYMDIKPLLDLTCATVASMIKVGRSILYSV
jgi:hypothetical protein